MEDKRRFMYKKDMEGMEKRVTDLDIVSWMPFMIDPARRRELWK